MKWNELYLSSSNWVTLVVSYVFVSNIMISKILRTQGTAPTSKKLIKTFLNFKEYLSRRLISWFILLYVLYQCKLFFASWNRKLSTLLLLSEWLLLIHWTQKCTIPNVQKHKPGRTSTTTSKRAPLTLNISMGSIISLTETNCAWFDIQNYK